MAISIEVVSKGRNSLVKLTQDDGRVDWIGAKTELAAQETAIAIRLGFDDTSISLTQFFNRFMEHHAIPNLSPGTVSQYRRIYIEQVQEALGEVNLAELSSAQVNSFFAAREAEGQTNRGNEAPFKLLSTMLSTAVRWRYLPSNPLDKMDAPPNGNAPR